MALKKIFEPFTINQTTFKNRLVVSAMDSSYCRDGGYASKKFIAYHERKARGGFGLIITEDICITPEAAASNNLAGLWKDEQIASFKELTDRVHAQGAKMFAQIYHAGRETSSAVTGVRCVAPSAIKDPTIGETPRELTVEEIKDLVKAFGDCARRAQLAGFDGVEIHGAHGYLIEQFLSTFSNHRCDEYGGTIQNRCRFMVEIVEDIREKCGRAFPIQLRLTANEYLPGGLAIEEAKVVARIAEEAGVDSINVSQGAYGSLYAVLPPSCTARAAFIDNAYEIKKAVSIPVLGVGKINDPFVAESVIASGKADACCMGRASLADPDMPRKAAAGKYDDILRCVGCLQGCIGENNRGNFVRCMVNPLTGMETEYDLSPVAEPKHIVVIGGGVAGCEAAIAAAQRGHKVTLLEKTGTLGGQFIVASVPVGKGDFSSFIVWQKHTLKKLGVDVRLNTEADRELVDSFKPDTVIVANGSNPAMPPVPGLRDNSEIAHKYLRGEIEFGEKVVVIGGGLVGAETADHMAVHGAKDVTIIEMQPDIMLDGEPIPNEVVFNRFKQYGVKVVTSARVTSVEADAVTYEKDGASVRIDGVNTIVNATGVKPDGSVAAMLEGAPYEVVIAGDASSAKNGFKNIQEGYEAGLRV